MRHAVSPTTPASRETRTFRPTVWPVTGLIYLVIIVLWAVVLIPMWLRRHDQVSEVRSTARFSSAMRSLGTRRNPEFVLQMSVPAGRRAQGRSMPSSYDRSYDRSFARANERQYDLDPEYERELIRQTAATRRAIVLGVLTLALLLSLILAVLSVVPKWLPVLVVVPLAAFIVAAIMTAGARRQSREYSSDLRRTEQRVEHEPIEAAPAAAADDWDTWDAWEDADSWTAVPTTLPTYVSAPRASAVPRKIDRSRPGEWTGSAMVETAQAMRRNVDELHAADPPAMHDNMFDDMVTAEIPVVRRNRAASA